MVNVNVYFQTKYVLAQLENKKQNYQNPAPPSDILLIAETIEGLKHILNKLV